MPAHRVGVVPYSSAEVSCVCMRMKGTHSTIKQSARVRPTSRNNSKIPTRSVSRDRTLQGSKQVPTRLIVPASAPSLGTNRCIGCEPLLRASFHGHQSAILKCIILKDSDGALP